MDKHYCPYCMTPVAEGESCSVCGLTAGTYVPSPHHLPPGTILLDRYLVGRVLGEGGFGITYIGCDLRLELKVAIKEYYPVDRATRNSSASLEVTSFVGASAKSFERGKQKFLGEAQVMARMDKQQVIVGVRDFFEINNTAYIVMEYIEGITFHDLVEQKGGKIPPEDLFPMIEPLFGALSMMHEKGLIHRDISPDNLMLENGKIRLLDFGCAREASRGTETMTIALKHGYAPLEQYQQKGQGPWTDIYALCATIYYCLTGKTPPQALDRISEDGLMIPSKLGIQLSENQERALLRGMQIKPNRRFSTMEELQAALYADPDGGLNPAVLPVTQATDGREDSDSAAENRNEENTDTDILNGEKSDEENPDTDNLNEPYSDTSISENEDSDGPVLTGEKLTEKETIAKKPDTSKKMKILLVMIFVVCAAAVIAAVGTRLAKRNSNDAVKNMQADTGDQTADLSVFEGASLFTSGDSAEFQNLMDDEAVTAIVVDCKSFFTSGISVTKPVLIEKDADWDTDDMIISETGYLQVDGVFTASGYLRLLGKDSVRLFISENGDLLTEECTLIWMDDKSSLIREDGEFINTHKLEFPMDIFDQADVVSVKTFDELVEAAEAEKTISIDGDITLTDDICFGAPVRISEGVTVNTISDAGSYCFFLDQNGGVLVNNGMLNGNLHSYIGYVINNGTLGSITDENKAFISLWIENHSILVNFGEVNAEDCSRIWSDSLFVNKGTLSSYEFCIVNGDMANFGNIVLKNGGDFGGFQDYGYFQTVNGGFLWNIDGATVTVNENTELMNDGRILNDGDIIAWEGGRIRNSIMENNGLLQAEEGVDFVGNSGIGIYYGKGEFDVGSAQIKIYSVGDLSFDPDDTERFTQVTSSDELVEAIDDPEVEAVLISSNITMDTDLIVRKPLFITGNSALTLAKEATLISYGSPVVLLEDASLKGRSITLYEDAQICIRDDSTLLMKDGGTLILDSSLIWGDGGNIQLEGVEISLNDEAGFALPEMSDFDLKESTVDLQGNTVFVSPYAKQKNLSDTVFTLKEGSVFKCSTDLTLKNCDIDIGENAYFYNTAGTLVLNNCAVTVQENGNLESDLSNLLLYSGSVLKNSGWIRIGGWDEYSFKLHGAMDNYGDLYLDLSNYSFSEPINNLGNVYFREGVGDPSLVTGNAPVTYE